MKTIKELQDRFAILLEVLKTQRTDLVTIGLDAEEIRSVLYYLKIANEDCEEDNNHDETRV